jgi:cytidine deaminase
MGEMARSEGALTAKEIPAIQLEKVPIEPNTLQCGKIRIFDRQLGIMKAEELRITVYTYESEAALPEESRVLVERARQASGRAWAPYSHFSVGAALMLENGEVVEGNNQENGAFPSGLCAERVALFHAGANYPGVAVTKIAIAAAKEGRFIDQPVFPCGGCRQTMIEMESRSGKPMEVIMVGAAEIKVVKQAADLVPLPFNYRSQA